MKRHYKPRRKPKQSYRPNKPNHHNPQQKSIPDVDSIYIIQPKGKPCWIWVRLSNEGRPETRLYDTITCPYHKLTMEYEGEYKTVFTQHHEFLTIGNGTLVKGTLTHIKCNQTQKDAIPVFTISETIWWKGEFVFQRPYLPVLHKLSTMIKPMEPHLIQEFNASNCKQHKQNKQNKKYKKSNSSQHPQTQLNSIQLAIPLLIPGSFTKIREKDKQTILEYLDGIPYSVYQILKCNGSSLFKQCERYSWDTFRKKFIPKQTLKKTFRVVPFNEQDVYSLYDGTTLITHYAVYDIQTSRTMKRWFGNIYGIDCLDDIEESDVEDEPIHERMIEFTKSSNGWNPIRLIS